MIQTALGTPVPGAVPFGPTMEASVKIRLFQMPGSNPIAKKR